MSEFEVEKVAVEKKKLLDRLNITTTPNTAISVSPVSGGWIDTTASPWRRSGMVGPIGPKGAETETVREVEGDTPGCSALRALAREYKQKLSEDDYELNRLKDQTRRVRERRKEPAAGLKELEKELELLEAYARMRRDGESDV